jgi:hypothetical protein
VRKTGDCGLRRRCSGGTIDGPAAILSPTDSRALRSRGDVWFPRDVCDRSQK